MASSINICIPTADVGLISVLWQNIEASPIFNELPLLEKIVYHESHS
jgi:hypothetical protein